jgi:flagellar FliJ protein
MAKPRSQRMHIVLTLAQKAEDDAAQKVKEQADLLKQEIRQLDELKSYSGQYLQAYANLRDGVSAQEMINYSGFIGRLADAIKEQENKKERIQQGLDKLKLVWAEMHQKRKTLNDLIDRLKKDESATLEKLLQKEMDELANRPNSLC